MSNEIGIDATRARELVDEGAQLIDVREDYEVEAGRIPGSRHVSMGSLQEQAASIDKDAPVVFYCRLGGRSDMAAQAFRGAGYEAYSLDGGIVDYAADHEIDGEVAEH